jgi:23S rRNA (guanosine2251-2'-O)-methyltransferase
MPIRERHAGRPAREPIDTARRQPLYKKSPAKSRTKNGRPNVASDRRASSPDLQSLTGLHAVREALRARRRRLHRLFLRTGKPRAEYEQLIELARSAGVDVVRVDGEELDRRLEFDENHQGIVLEAGPLPEVSLRELIDHAARAEGGRRLLALDGVEDPQNVGSVARVAESAGVLGMILTDRRAPALTPSVARASAGAIEWLPVARVANLARALTELKGEDYWVLAAALGGGGSLYEMEDRLLTGNLVVVLGAEGRGVRRSILDQADHRVEIPMIGHVDSLNVATAGAVLLYELMRRAGRAFDRTSGS